MFTLSVLREEFARGLLCFYPARLEQSRRACPENNRRAPLPASRQNSAKSNNSPRYAPLRCNSNVSPTYAKTGGYTPSKMSARRHFPSYSRNTHLLPAAASAKAGFQSFAHSFIFRSTPISCAPNAFRTLPKKTGGIPPARSYQFDFTVADLKFGHYMGLDRAPSGCRMAAWNPNGAPPHLRIVEYGNRG